MSTFFAAEMFYDWKKFQIYFILRLVFFFQKMYNPYDTWLEAGLNQCPFSVDINPGVVGHRTFSSIPAPPPSECSPAEEYIFRLMDEGVDQVQAQDQFLVQLKRWSYVPPFVRKNQVRFKQRVAHLFQTCQEGIDAAQARFLELAQEIHRNMFALDNPLQVVILQYFVVCDQVIDLVGQGVQEQQQLIFKYFAPSGTHPHLETAPNTQEMLARLARKKRHVV